MHHSTHTLFMSFTVTQVNGVTEKKLELRVVLYYYIPTPPRGFLLVAYVEKFHSFLIYILMSPRVAVSRQGGSKPANQILLQDNYIHKYYDDNNVYVDRN